MPQGVITPLNSILYAGDPDTMQEYEVKTYANLAPGRLVITDTYEYAIQVAGAAATDIIGVADIMSDEKLTLMQTETADGAPLVTYAAGDQVRVLRGDIVVKLLAKSGETIAVGTRLIAAAAGMVAANAVEGQTVGYSLQNATAHIAAKCGWVLVKLQL